MYDTFTGKLVTNVKVGWERESVIFMQHLGEDVTCCGNKGTVTFYDVL